MRPGYWFCSWLARTYFRLMYGLRVQGLEHIPRTGRCIIASNHRSNYDPPILGGVIPREVHFFAKEELFRGVLGRLISYLNAFPVRRGQFDREALTTCVDVLKREGALIFYPEGTRAPAEGFLQAKLGLGWVVTLSDAPVVPVYIHGSAGASGFRWRGRPGLLATFGPAVPAEALRDPALRGRELYQQISDRVLELIREVSLETPGGRVREKGPIFDRSILDNERLR